jgi:tetratricopeptide (TPR) repeat protein
MILIKDSHMTPDNELDLIRDELVKAMRLAEQGKYRQSIDTCVRCLKTAAQKAIPLPEGFAGALLTRMGLSMAAQNDWEQALFHYRLAEGVLLRRKETVRQVRARYQIALYSTDDDLRLLLADIYQALAQAYDAREETERSISYYKQAYKVAQSMENIGLSWRALTSIAANYQSRGLWNDLQAAAERLLNLNARDPQSTREMIARRYLAQAYGKTGCLQDMLTELERIVAIGRGVGHPDLPQDERALARAQQTLAAVQSKPSVITSSSVSMITLDPDQVRVTGTLEMAALPAPLAGNQRSVPTPTEVTKCPTDLIHNITIETQNQQGVQEAAFILHTRYFDKAVALFQLFRPTLLSVSIPGMKQLGDTGVQLPETGSLYLEWSLHDLLPNMLMHTVVIPDNKLEALEQTNRQTRRLTLYLESKDGRFGKRKRSLLPGLFEPYILDWRGMTGLVRYLRRNSMEKNATLDEQEAYHLLTLLQMPLKDGLPATGIYREMGFIYRQMQAYESAIASFQEEISFGLSKEGVPAPHTAQSFRQMGLIYQTLEQRDKAFDAFRVALALNPNSFDTLIAITSILPDPTEALRYLGRAWRIRRDDPNWAHIMEEAAQNFNRTVSQIEQAVAIIATQVDLSSRYEFDRSALARLGIQ